MKYKVMVFGSNSFSGSDFIDLLLENPRYDVIGVSRSPENSQVFLPYKRHMSSSFKFYQLDFNHDMERIFELVDSYQPDYVINFAAQGEVGPSWDNPDHWFQTNAVSLVKFTNYLKDKTYLKKYVHISSPEVYGTCHGVVTEDAPLNPSTPYAASKAHSTFRSFLFCAPFSFFF